MRKDRSRPSRYTQPDLVCPGGNTSQRVSARHETLVTQRSGQRTDQRSTERRTNHTCTEQRSPRVYEIATRRTLSAGHSARRSDRTSHRQAIRTAHIAQIIDQDTVSAQGIAQDSAQDSAQTTLRTAHGAQTAIRTAHIAQTTLSTALKENAQTSAQNSVVSLDSTGTIATRSQTR